MKYLISSISSFIFVHQVSYERRILKERITETHFVIIPSANTSSNFDVVIRLFDLMKFTLFWHLLLEATAANDIYLSYKIGHVCGQITCLNRYNESISNTNIYSNLGYSTKIYWYKVQILISVFWFEIIIRYNCNYQYCLTNLMLLLCLRKIETV